MKKIDAKGKKIEIMPLLLNSKEYLGRYTVNYGYTYWYFATINDCYEFVQANFCNYLLRTTDRLGVVDEENHLTKPKKFDIRDIFDTIFGDK